MSKQEENNINLASVDVVLGITEKIPPENTSVRHGVLLEKRGGTSIWRVQLEDTAISVVMEPYEYYPGINLPEVGESVVGILYQADGVDRFSVNRVEILTNLLEGICPEVRDGRVRVMRVARIPGVRTKIAVAATVSNIDPVSVCVGKSASRIKTLMRYLGGERIDIIFWHKDIERFIANALAPAQLTSLEVRENDIKVYVPSHQMAAAVGQKGLNASLASKLVGAKLIVVSDTKAI
jgi:N utilization substance protein A